MKQLLVRLEKLVGDAEIFVAGGAVRDLLLGRDIVDIDLVTSHDPASMSKRFSDEISGTLVALDERYKIYRVVSTSGYYFDFSALRHGATSILEDLEKRDLTINAMAMRLGHYLQSDLANILDPLDGKRDMRKKLIRWCSCMSFLDDPLRILRAFRFSLELDFEIEINTLRGLIECQKDPGFKHVAPERIDFELCRILKHPASWKAMGKMAESGTLNAVLPEFQQAEGVDQPGFHHLDVFWHLIETLRQMEDVIQCPERFFGTEGGRAVRSYLENDPRRTLALKWAALLHDIGKPRVKGHKGNRVTFYNHDREGTSITKEIARRLRWPRWREELVAKFVAYHMRPFHLLNDLRSGGPSPRAMRRLLKELKDDYVGLFILSMADTLAGSGPLKPKELEHEIRKLFQKLHGFMLETLEPVVRGKKILTGTDVMDILGIPQGPLVGRALDAIEEAQCQGRITDKAAAKRFLIQWHQGSTP